MEVGIGQAIVAEEIAIPNAHCESPPSVHSKIDPLIPFRVFNSAGCVLAGVSTVIIACDPQVWFFPHGFSGRGTVSDIDIWLSLPMSSSMTLVRKTCHSLS